MSAETVDKAVWLESLERVRDVIGLLERVYDTDVWTGGILFQESQYGGFLLVACFDPDQYMAFGTPWERLFAPGDLRAVTLEEACADKRLRPWLAGDIPATLRLLKLLPT